LGLEATSEVDGLTRIHRGFESGGLDVPAFRVSPVRGGLRVDSRGGASQRRQPRASAEGTDEDELPTCPRGFEFGASDAVAPAARAREAPREEEAWEDGEEGPLWRSVWSDMSGVQERALDQSWRETEGLVADWEGRLSRYGLDRARRLETRVEWIAGTLEEELSFEEGKSRVAEDGFGGRLDVLVSMKDDASEELVRERGKVGRMMENLRRFRRRYSTLVAQSAFVPDDFDDV
jgi:hypothetical protein